jgi:hypothetical protein
MPAPTLFCPLSLPAVFARTKTLFLPAVFARTLYAGCSRATFFKTVHKSYLRL